MDYSPISEYVIFTTGTVTWWFTDQTAGRIAAQLLRILANSTTHSLVFTTYTIFKIINNHFHKHHTSHELTCRLLYMSYFCLIFQRTAATRSKSRKQLQNHKCTIQQQQHTANSIIIILFYMPLQHFQWMMCCIEVHKTDYTLNTRFTEQY
jgi:hypothetical protein